MARLLNAGRRILGLPGRSKGDTSVSPFSLRPGESRDVPGWYVEGLLEIKGPAARFSRGDLQVEDGAEPTPAPSTPAGDDLAGMDRDQLREFARERGLEVDLRLGADALRDAIAAALTD